MRALILVLLALMCAAPFVVSSVEAEPTVSGMLVEAACGLHLGEDGPSDEHVACMVRCARNGDPIGILTDEGLYTITGSWLERNETRLAELMAQQVVATGEISHEGGQLQIDVAFIELAK